MPRYVVHDDAPWCGEPVGYIDARSESQARSALEALLDLALANGRHMHGYEADYFRLEALDGDPSQAAVRRAVRSRSGELAEPVEQTYNLADLGSPEHAWRSR